MKIKRVYHHYTKCEEFQSCMWKTGVVIDRDAMAKDAVNFMVNTKDFEAAMVEVIGTWPNSCELNFTNPSINHVAWLGQAACAIAIQCPEEITKSAWGNLDKLSQDEANIAAMNLVAKWKEEYWEKSNG